MTVRHSDPHHLDMPGGQQHAVTTIADALRASGETPGRQVDAAAEQLGIGVVRVSASGTVTWSDSTYRWHGRPRWRRVRSIGDALDGVGAGLTDLSAAYAALSEGGDGDGVDVPYEVIGDYDLHHSLVLRPVAPGVAIVTSASAVAPAEPEALPEPEPQPQPLAEDAALPQVTPLPAPTTADAIDLRTPAAEVVAAPAKAITVPAPEANGITWRELFDSSPVSLAVIDGVGRFRQVNAAFCAFVGRSREEVLATVYDALLHPADRSTTSAAEGPEEAVHERRLVRGDGETVWGRIRTSAVNLDGALCTMVAIEDVTDAKQTEARLRREALQDPLTGLPNRRLLVDRLSRALSRSHRTRAQTAVFFVDVDGLKRVNDTHGHGAGDQLIITVATSLRKALRETDTLARIGGDEFVAVCEDIADGQALQEVGRRLLRAAPNPFTVDGDDVPITLSVGVAVAESEDDTAEAVLSRADAAMYEAKLAGGARLVTSASSLGGAPSHAPTVEDWRVALQSGALHLHYRPVLSLTGDLFGIEALPRWDHPWLSTLTVDDLLDTPGNGEVAGEVARWALQRALADLRPWSGGQAPLLWLEVPARALLQPATVAAVAAGYADYDADSQPALVLQVREDDLAGLLRRGGPPAALADITAAGPVSLGITRFRAESVPLAALRQLPLRNITVDHALLPDPHGGPDAAPDPLLGAIVAAARAVGVDAVAADVSDTDVMATLSDLGFVAVHGELVGPGGPLESYADLLSNGRLQLRRPAETTEPGPAQDRLPGAPTLLLRPGNRHPQ